MGATYNAALGAAGYDAGYLRGIAKLGEQLGLTFQQIQKYEKGTNRVGATDHTRADYACPIGQGHS